MTDVVACAADDLLGLTAALVDIPSVSRDEAALAATVADRLTRRTTDLDIVRIGANVVARSDHRRPQRAVLAGHLDTVPANGNERARVDGDVLHGLGSADMKGGLAVMLRLAEEIVASARFDITFVFYEAEEIADQYNGLRRLFAERADLVAGDVAVLLEPTACGIEAGCQGTVRVDAHFRGKRAHTARPWMGVNAIHRAASTLARLAAYEPAVVDIDGLSFREALQVIKIEGGVAGNVVPDHCVIGVNRRFAPSRSVDDVLAELRELLADADEVEIDNASPAAAPHLDRPLVAELVALVGSTPRPKLGWTDVARFSAAGIPAVNFGPGDPDLAHTAEEWVDRASLNSCYEVLRAYLVG